MRQRSTQRASRALLSRSGSTIAAALLLLLHVHSGAAKVFPSRHELYKFDYLHSYPGFTRDLKRSLSKRDNPIPLVITNNCGDTIWPGIATQSGDGPESGGFELAPGKTRNLTVGPTWQGRCWGRTNCTVSGDTATCETGDCFGKLDCQYSGATPVTLAEFNLAGGTTGNQCYYDISLVDGYNLPLGLVYIPAANTTDIPPNFLNAACIATAGYLGGAGTNRTGTYYTNSSYPMPYEDAQTNSRVARWCPWDLQAYPPSKPGDGVYPYPDDNIQRPIFDPCKSACAATNSPSDCCTGKYGDPGSCHPSEYSRAAKAMCPDAYSYAFDDQTSTFIIPSGGGWEVVFCPEGRSTNILATFGSQLQAIASEGTVTEEMRKTAMNLTYIDSKHSGAAKARISTLVVSIVAAAVAGSLMV